MGRTGLELINSQRRLMTARKMLGVMTPIDIDNLRDFIIACIIGFGSWELIRLFQ